MISFASAPGNLFNCLGRLGLLIKTQSAYQQSQLVNMTDTTNGVVAQFNAESDIQAMMGSSYIGVLSGCESAVAPAQQIANAIINRKVFRDAPQPGQTLQQGNIVASIQEVIRQMKSAGATVLAQTITATPSTFVGSGNGVIVASTRRPSDGLVLENAFSESMTLTCTQDSYSGFATAGSELFTLAGDGAETDLFAFDWPLGSAASATLQAINGDEDNAQANLLTNGGFSEWTANIPDNFTILNGASTITEETSVIYSDTGALKITGDGSTLTAFQQVFGSTDGTAATLGAQTQYSFCVFMRGGPAGTSTGVMTVSLVDENDNVVDDAAGNPNVLTFNLTSLNTVYTAFTGVFRTPVIIPAEFALRIELTTALTNGQPVYMDRMSMGAMMQAYVSGPYLAIHSGSDNFVAGDIGTCTIVNGRGAGGTLNTFQTLLFRLLAPNIQSFEFLFPSSSSPSISDTLIG